MPTLAATYTFPLGTTVAARDGEWGEGVGGAGGTGAAAPHAPPLRAGGYARQMMRQHATT